MGDTFKPSKSSVSDSAGASVVCQEKQVFLAMKKIEYLGHMVSKEGAKMDAQKVESIKAWPTPKFIKELRGFLGLLGYY